MKNKKILIIDDEPDIRNVYSDILTEKGYEVTTAANGEDALKILKNESFFVLFVDLNLPDIQGSELCRKIRNLYPMAITFAITGYASLLELTDCRDAGFEDYFLKPVKMKDLVDAASMAFCKLSRWKNKKLQNGRPVNPYNLQENSN